MMSCAFRITTISSLHLSQDDEDSKYLTSYKSRPQKRPMVEYDNSRMKKSRTVNDLSSLINGCNEDVRKVPNNKSDVNLKSIGGDRQDNLNYYRQPPPLDIGLESHFLFLTMTAPVMNSHYEVKDYRMKEIVEDVYEEDCEDGAPSI